MVCCILAGSLPVHDSYYLYAQSKKKKSSVKNSSAKKAQASKYSKRGASRAKKKDYAGALKDYKKAYKLVPSKTIKKRIQQLQKLTAKRGSPKQSKNKKASQANAYVKRGTAKAKKKDYAGALKEFKRAYKLNPSPSNKKRIQQLTALLKKSSSKPTKGGMPVKAKIPQVSDIPTLSPVAFANDIYSITEAFEISSRQLSQATSYLDPPEGKKISSLSVSPAPTTKELETFARTEPNDLRRQIDLARHYESVGRFEDAKNIYLRLVTRNKFNPDTHFHLGSYYARFGQMNKARQSFEEGLDIQPSHQATLEAMATLFGTEEKTLLSKEVLSHSAEKSPTGPARRIQAIRNALEDGRYKTAAKLAEGGGEMFKHNSRFIYLKGLAFIGLGDKEKAKQAFQESIKKDPTLEEAYLSLADLYFNLGKYVYAALSYGDIIRLKPANVNARFQQGLSYYRAHEWGRAASAWEDLLHYEPHHKSVRKVLPQTYYILAVEYNRAGEAGLGQEAFRKALSVNKDSGDWLSGSMGTLGEYYRGKGMFRESLAAYQEVIELEPRNASAYLGLGITYWKMKEKGMAMAAWQRSMELDPKNNDARGWLLLAGKSSG